MSEDLLQCYNKGCGKKYKEEENSEECCVFHPGVPVFHDAMKGWSCCKKRSTDFTDFLHIPGCTTGKHNPVKPPEPEKAPMESLKSGEEIIVKGPPPPKSLKDIERPPEDLPYDVLRVKVANSLASLLARLRLQEKEEEQEKMQLEEDNQNQEIPMGTNCKNTSCDALYVGPESDLTACQHHPGVAIFHDGYKFWSCCQRRTSDFNEFQRQEGCTSGSHAWVKAVKTQTCRMDWHQTGSSVVITFYAKTCLPERSLIEANPTNIRVCLTFENGKTEFSKDIKLYGVVDVSRSSVDMMSSKVEVKLRKADPISWADLFFKEL